MESQCEYCVSQSEYCELFEIVRIRLLSVIVVLVLAHPPEPLLSLPCHFLLLCLVSIAILFKGAVFTTLTFVCTN